jgi:hypothetical protein
VVAQGSKTAKWFDIFTAELIHEASTQGYGLCLSSNGTVQISFGGKSSIELWAIERE